MVAQGPTEGQLLQRAPAFPKGLRAEGQQGVAAEIQLPQGGQGEGAGLHCPQVVAAEVEGAEVGQALGGEGAGRQTG